MAALFVCLGTGFCHFGVDVSAISLTSRFPADRDTSMHPPMLALTRPKQNARRVAGDRKKRGLARPESESHNFHMKKAYPSRDKDRSEHALTRFSCRLVTSSQVP